LYNKILSIGDTCISIFVNSYQLIIRVVRGNPIGVKGHRILMLRGKPDVVIVDVRIQFRELRTSAMPSESLG